MTNTNIGDGNTGSENTGDSNTGDSNTGNWNTGDWNTGRRNTGDWNTGNCNTSEWNTGDRNTGDRNTGNHNTGKLNTGHHNTGQWNTGDYHTGCFNTKPAEKAYYFNKLGSVKEWLNAQKPDWIFQVSLTEWVASSDMTDAEKEAHPSHETTGGYLRVNDIKEQYQKAYAATSEEDRELTRQLPNFDAEVLLEITGVDMRETKQLREIEIDGVVYTLVRKQD